MSSTSTPRTSSGCVCAFMISCGKLFLLQGAVQWPIQETGATCLEPDIMAQ